MNNYLYAVMATRAELVNATTEKQMIDNLDTADPDVPPAAVFASAINVRAPAAGRSLTSTIAGMAGQEAGMQVHGDLATKTWAVRSRKPRPEHAKMSGQTVPINDTFSNGALWPGDSVLGVDGIAGCTCELVINPPEGVAP